MSLGRQSGDGWCSLILDSTNHARESGHKPITCPAGVKKGEKMANPMKVCCTIGVDSLTASSGAIIGDASDGR